MAGHEPTRLELIWPNKDKFLLSPRDRHGKPVWVDRSHPAASEVRLVDFTGTCGEVRPDGQRVSDNLLFIGDSLDVLRILAEHPEFRREYRGKVKCVYIDPPFNTGQAFEHYDDWMEHSTWLSFMRDRLLLIRDLLADDGSLWVHLDDVEQHRMRCLMDEVFGGQNFVANIVWEKADSTRNDAKGFSAHQDYIAVYGRSAAFTPNRLPRPESASSRFASPDGDETDWFDDNPTAPGARTHQGMVYAIQHPISGELIYPSRGRVWWTEQSKVLMIMSEYARYELRDIGDAEHRADLCGVDADAVRVGVRAVMLADDLRTSAVAAQARYDAGNWPQIVLRSGGRGGMGRKAYPSAAGLVPNTWWSNDQVGHNREAKAEIKALFPGVTPFATPKPERLIQRILHIATVPGDLVLDCFAGSGTTAAVAHKMGRRWATSEILPATVGTFVVPRLGKVAAGADPGGVTGAVGWTGGSGFRSLAVCPSMYEVADNGTPLLADWSTNGRFSRGVAAQLDFDFQDGSAPFCGRRGRTRLAVFDGAAGPEEVRTVVAALGSEERVTIVAKVVLPEAEELLAALSKGSRIRKAPRDVLADVTHTTRRPEIAR